MARSALYRGHLSHARSGGVNNAFRYRIGLFALDVDELPALTRRLRLFGHERRRLFSLRDADYVDAARLGLRGAIEAFLAGRGVDWVPARIVLYTQTRVAGYVFNPVSFFACYRGAGDEGAACVVAEVNNTFGQTHRYLLDDRNRVGERRHVTAKEFFVSPFLSDDHDYEWQFGSLGGEALSIRMTLWRRGVPRFVANLVGERTALDDRELFSSLCRTPLMPLQIIAQIHLQAFRLYARGLQYRRPPHDDTAHPDQVRAQARPVEPDQHLAARPARAPHP